MFASRSFGAFQGGRNSLDLPVAALAGLAVAFVAFAAPADLLASLVGASGLPALIPAAEPPLGLKARVGLGAGGALIVFAAAFLVLRWLDRFGARRAEQAEEAAAELEVPRLRRRDIHPDAPARMPLLAVHELGEPELVLDEPEPEPEPLAPGVEPSPLLARKPDRLAELEAYAPLSFEPEPPVAEASTPVDLPDAGPSDQAGAYALSQRNWADFEPEPQPDAGPAAEPIDPWLAEPAVQAEPEWQPPSPQAWGFEEAGPIEPQEAENGAGDPPFATAFEADAEPEAEAVAQPEWPQPAAPVEAWNGLPPISIAPAPAEPETAQPAEPEPQVALAAPRPATGSIAELMERLEKGLARHRVAPAEPVAPLPLAASAAQIAPVPNLSPDPADDRLQNAIESLQRFASRQD